MADTSIPSNAQRAELEAVVQSNPANPAARMKLAQHDARQWAISPSAETLELVLGNVEAALAQLPPTHTAQVGAFLSELDRRGANLASYSGRYPRVNALAATSASPSPTDSSPSSTAFRSATSTPGTPVPQKKAPAGSTKTAVRNIEVGEVTNAKLKVWIDGNQLEELASAFPLIDNIRTQRMVLDKLGATQSPLSAACLVRLLATTHDEVMNNEIRKKLLAFDHEMLGHELIYDPNDAKMKWAVVSLFGSIETENAANALALALSDPIGSVRAAAIEGLAPKTENSPEWIGRLTQFIKKDEVPTVRLAAARALQTLGSREAFDALDATSQEAEFDTALIPVLDEMRGKFGGGRSQRLKAASRDAKAKREASTKKSGPRFEARDLVKLAVGAVVLVGALGLIYLQAKHYTSSLSENFVPAPAIGKEEAARRRKETAERVTAAIAKIQEEQSK